MLFSFTNCKAMPMIFTPVRFMSFKVPLELLLKDMSKREF